MLKWILFRFLWIGIFLARIALAFAVVFFAVTTFGATLTEDWLPAAALALATGAAAYFRRILYIGYFA